MQLSVRIAKRADMGYTAWYPALPGCRVWGSTRREALRKAREAAQGYLEHLDEALPRELGRQFAAETASEMCGRAALCAH
ncbi:MAG: type II toxin-antitoxin system HicB family antitoxin [Planctomycetota bacterium]